MWLLLVKRQKRALFSVFCHSYLNVQYCDMHFVRRVARGNPDEARLRTCSLLFFSTTAVLSDQLTINPQKGFEKNPFNNNY